MIFKLLHQRDIAKKHVLFAKLGIAFNNKEEYDLENYTTTLNYS